MFGKNLILVLAALTLGGCGFFSSEAGSPQDPTTETFDSSESSTVDGQSSYTPTSKARYQSTAPAGASVNRIVAAVNGEIITLSQLDARINAVTRGRKPTGDAGYELEKKVLDGLIEQELVNQAAKAKGVFVTESDVSNAVNAVKTDNKLTDAQFEASLAQSGTTMEGFRENLRMELLRNRIMGSQVVSKVVVTDAEVVKFLNGEGPDPKEMGIRTGPPDTRAVRLIIIPLNPQNKQASLNEAKKIMAEIEGGLSFAEAARKYSKGPGRDKGGDTGDGASVDKLPPPLQAALADKKAGEPIGPLEAGNAVIVMSPATDPAPTPKPSGKRSADEFSTEEKEKARRQLEAYKLQKRFGDWLKDLKRNAVIRVNL